MSSSLKHKKVAEKRLNLKNKDTGFEKKVTVKTFRMPNGLEEDYFIDNDKDSVQVFAITKDQNVVCVKQFRPGPEEVILELPGGGLDPGEDSEAAAARELTEETGYGSEMPPIFLASPTYSPYSSGKRYMYMMLECEKVSKDLDLDPNEFVEPVLFPLREFVETWVKTGKVRGYEGVFLGLAKLKTS